MIIKLKSPLRIVCLRILEFSKIQKINLIFFCIVHLLYVFSKKYI